MRALLLALALAAIALGLLDGASRKLERGARQGVARAEDVKPNEPERSAAASPAGAPAAPAPVPADNAQPQPAAEPDATTTPDGAASPAQGVRPLDADLATLRAALRGVPALATAADVFTPFTDADVDAALKRGGRSRGSVTVWTFQPAAFAWSPRAGRELWVLSGRAGARTLIAVLERKGERFEHAASLLIDEPDATVAIGFSARYPEQLVWSSCYGCAGEGGTVLSRDDGRIEFAYR